ncbi:MAG TPA: hypothetical protein VGS41_04205, partial [Chthonomonadales bacterium]|nr:hypothetical protein [Chthonomonadales bacterium]
AFSLSAVVAFFLASAVLSLALIGREWLQLRQSNRKWTIGWRPLGGAALILALLWIAVAILSLVDIQSGHRLYMNAAILDECYRVNWTEAVLHSGIPPANPLYMYKHPAIMRNHYFWYVLCAAIARMCALPVRAVVVASSVWAGFFLAALNGLYLKHFLAAGGRLRKQFLRSLGLIAVGGLDIFAILVEIFYFHGPLHGDINLWSPNPIFSWLNNLFWSPHQLASLACCMFAFLLAWMAGQDGRQRQIASVVLIAAALASAFGLSVYVTFVFFLVMVAWAPWQVFSERRRRPVWLMAAGGAGAMILLIPDLWELTHTSSGIHGPSLFGFTVREMIPTDGLLASRFLQPFAGGHPVVAQDLANLVLLAPGYALELGFYFAVFLICVVPAWRGRTPLTAAQRSLVFICVATFPIITFVRCNVLPGNDFSFRGALLIQYSLLLLGSEVITAWSLADSKHSVPIDSAGLPSNSPQWLRSVAALALVIGATTIVCQALVLRSITFLGDWHTTTAYGPGVLSRSHNAYISSIGYAQLDAAIPQNAVVQFNPFVPEPFWVVPDQIGVARQTAIAGDQPWCGAEIGGDPSGCQAMAAALDSLYHGATAEQARATCRQYGIQYLVARIFDPVWSDKSSWVWTLPPVVQDPEFRGLDCR